MADPVNEPPASDSPTWRLTGAERCPDPDRPREPAGLGAGLGGRQPAADGRQPAALRACARELARGGLGRIHFAWDRRLARAVAIKEPLTEGARARFYREALLTARLQHPGIVPIYDAGNGEDGAPFYAMRLLGEGRSFSDAIAAAPGLEERLTLLPHVIAAADAVAYAHSQRIIHRDLKPDNILLGPFGETVVIDWGLAKDLAAAEPAMPEEPGAAQRRRPPLPSPGTPAGYTPSPSPGRHDPADPGGHHRRHPGLHVARAGFPGRGRRTDRRLFAGRRSARAAARQTGGDHRPPGDRLGRRAAPAAAARGAGRPDRHPAHGDGRRSGRPLPYRPRAGRRPAAFRRRPAGQGHVYSPAHPGRPLARPPPLAGRHRRPVAAAAGARRDRRGAPGGHRAQPRRRSRANTP